MAKVIDKLMDVLKLGYEEDDDYEDYEEEYEEEKPRKFFNKSKSDDVADKEPKDSIFKKEKKVKEPVKNDKVQTRTTGNVSLLKGGTGNSMSSGIYSIRPLDDSAKIEIGSKLLKGQNVLINLEGLDIDLAQSIVDFTAGVCFAIDGDMKHPSKYFVLAVPNKVELSGIYEGEENNTPGPMNMTFDKFNQF